MKLTLLGTGGPIPDPTRHGSAVALEIGDARLLFDAGRGVVLQLVRAASPSRRSTRSSSATITTITSAISAM